MQLTHLKQTKPLKKKTLDKFLCQGFFMERLPGFEPGPSAWKAVMLAVKTP